jgi:hypothetical protein
MARGRILATKRTQEQQGRVAEKKHDNDKGDESSTKHIEAQLGFDGL